jgi:hypothetical protein
MNVLEKIDAKFTTYSNRISTVGFRFIHSIAPGYFNVKQLETRVFPLGYAAPDELFLTEVPEKKQLWAEVIPGFKETYRFSDEPSYYQMYANARFAYTWKKGGWDCLRHYEIIANGTIPVFPDLSNCPKETLSQLPKDLIIRANKELLPWKELPEYHAKYQDYSKRILAESLENASCAAVATRFLKRLGANANQKILFLNCDTNVNYSRELLFIGLSRVQKAGEGVCHSFPRLDFLYDTYPVDQATKCYGKGFGYTRRLNGGEAIQSLPNTSAEIEKSISEGYWAFIVYGKMGTDEGVLGTAPTCPFWETVSEAYSKEQIAFVYGGDHMQDLNDMGSPHSRHLVKHAALGKCFVRELKVS